MKSFNVKSNAKRFARSIAAKYPTMYAVAEPVEVSEGAREWYPALTIVGEEFAACMGEVRSTCVMTNDEDENEPADTRIISAGLAAADVAAREPDAATAILTGKAPEFVTASAAIQADAVIVEVADHSEVALHGDMRPHQQEAVKAVMDSSVVIGEAKDAKLATMIAMAATLPPRKASSAEEIEARRAERRARIDAEKVTGKPKRITQKQVILDLIGKPDGATVSDLEAATGWQRHTLRGYIAGTMRKVLAPKFGIACIRKKGEPTRYVLTTAGGAQ